MLFAFRGMKFLQIILAGITLVAGLSCVLLIKVYADEKSPWPLLPATLLGIVFLWSFTATLRAPTSFVAVADERTRIRYMGQIDVVVANSDIIGARLVDRNILQGLGVKTNFRGSVALASATGPAAELTFRHPVRIWVLPKILPARATTLTVTVRHPAKLVERFHTGSLPKPAQRKMGTRGLRTR